MCAYARASEPCPSICHVEAMIAPVPDSHSRAHACALAAPADIITTVTESAYYGRCTSSAVASGIILVKTRRALILATYAEPVVAAEAIPHVHAFAEELERMVG